jgi:hypothetical protein
MRTHDPVASKNHIILLKDIRSKNYQSGVLSICSCLNLLEFRHKVFLNPYLMNKTQIEIIVIEVFHKHLFNISIVLKS